MPLVAPRIVNSVSCVTRIDHESHFAWQAQYLVKLKCHFSWQAQHSVKFGMIAGVILGMVSDRSRIVIDVSSVLEKCF